MAKVPELNFFDAVRQRPDGRHEIYTDIELVEPDWQLFAPPPDAVVVEGEMPSPLPGQGHAR